MELLAAYGIPTAGKHAVVIGRSMIVGKPMANLLVNKKANATVTMLQSWNAHNGVNEAAPVMSEQHDGQWKTMTFENADGVPMVKFTNVLRTAHIYMPEQPQAVWYDFFTKFTRGEDGTLFYEGNAVNAGEYAADAGWYEPAPAPEAK